MKVYFCQKIAVIFCFSLLFFYTYGEPKKANQKTQPSVESILLLPQQYGRDTVGLKNFLQPIIERAQKDNDVPILWACNMAMADVNSMFYDNINLASDAYYDKAKELLVDKKFPELIFVGNVRQGYYNFIYRRISDAFPFFLEANFIQPSLDYQRVPALNNHFNFIAGFYSYIGNQDRAKEYLELALPFTEEASRQRIDVLNSLSIYCREAGNDEKAQEYLKEALQEAESAHDSVWIGIISGNLSDYKWKEGKVDEAMSLLAKNIDLSTRYNERLDVMRSNLKMANHYLALQDLDNANIYVHKSLSLMDEKPYFLAFRVEAMKTLADIAFLKGDLLDERKFLKQYLLLKEELDKQVNSEEIKKISWKFEVEKYEETLQNNQIKEHQLKKTYSLIGLTLFLIAVIIVLLMNRARNQVKIKNIELEKSQLHLTYEKQIVDQELIQVKSSLAAFTNEISQNNIIISNLRKELANATDVDELLKIRVSDELNTMLQSHLMTHERWLGFKKEFEIVHPNYLYNLKSENPSLTENDLRIIALTKLNLNNRSMSDLLGISLEGIKKAKQRLKKKMTTTID